MERKINKIKTFGDMSPGYVNGNYIINQTIVDQYNSIKRKKWRNIDQIRYSVLHDNNNFRTGFLQHLVLALHKTFKDAGYTKFINDLIMYDYTIDNNDLTIYELLSHQPVFSENFRREHINSIERILSLQKNNDEKGFDEYKYEFIKQWDSHFSGWNIQYDVVFAEVWMPVEIIYDPIIKNITVRTIRNFSTNPKDYENGIVTTSEMLHLLASLDKFPIAYWGDFVWLKDNYPLLKLFIYVADNHEYNLGHIRINADDFEEWDYVNRDYDEEIKIQKNKKKK